MSHTHDWRPIADSKRRFTCECGAECTRERGMIDQYTAAPPRPKVSASVEAARRAEVPLRSKP